ncbi:uncharacterized protein [Oryza sativa Japonica Group]|uniref:uncharacterized protein isoform X2 n=1 Tax=Oryza sativa subsp. japonica TaxID=39947 RepID=UPI000E1BD5D7|nr:uncharacterized protein LOC9269359 isoform X2 [Oryza sativa Japonica Group]KAF2948654.1 hypothetical protein DAI22_01g050400 [Oryza sativa Japonica Group]KAF2948657.1 hypothetical protein DAI22_01g050400 [Oryza sativa Japonica Group]
MGYGFSTKLTAFFWPWRFSPWRFSPPPSTPMPRPHLPPPGAPSPTPMATAPALHNFPHASSSRRSPTLCDGLPLPHRHISTAPPPGPSPASPPKTIVKLASSIGTVVPVALSIVPYFYQVYTGNFERTIEVYGAPAMLAGSINSIIWLTYSIMASKKDLNLALILMHALLCMSTFTYLMCICACKRATKEGYILGAFFIGCLSAISIVVHWDLNPSKVVKIIFRCFGGISLLSCHYILLNDILGSVPKRSQKVATGFDLILSCITNLVTFIITFHDHPEHTTSLITSGVGFVLNVVEIVLLVIVTIMGYFFPLSEHPDADVEASRHISATRGMIPLEDALGTPETDDFIAVLTHEPQVPQFEVSYLILQVRNEFEIYSLRSMVNPNVQIITRVLFVEVIQRTMMRIERDHYIQILLQASGIAAAEPYPLMLRDVEIHYQTIRNQHEALP